jgi:hypothetical protein
MGWVVSVTPQPRFTPGERTPSTHWTGGWVGLRAGVDTEAREKTLSSAGDRTLDMQSVARRYTERAVKQNWTKAVSTLLRYRECVLKKFNILLKMPTDLHTSFVVMTRLFEGLGMCLNALLSLKVENSHLCFVGARIPTLYKVEWQFSLFFVCSLFVVFR